MKKKNLREKIEQEGFKTAPIDTLEEKTTVPENKEGEKIEREEKHRQAVIKQKGL